MIRISLRPALALAALVAATVPAFAHVELKSAEATKGVPYEGVLVVPHGCDGSPTTSLTVKLPEGLVNVEPKALEGWTVEAVSGAYASAHQLAGATISEGINEITWAGGSLDPHATAEFAFTGTFADDVEPTDTVLFPVIQSCEAGERAWIETSHDSENPAPGLKLLPN